MKIIRETKNLREKVKTYLKTTGNLHANYYYTVA